RNRLSPAFEHPEESPRKRDPDTAATRWFPIGREAILDRAVRAQPAAQAGCRNRHPPAVSWLVLLEARLAFSCRLRVRRYLRSQLPFTASRVNSIRRKRKRDSHHGEQLIEIYRLGHVVRCAGLQAFLAIAFHRFGRQSYYRKRFESGILTNRPHRLVAIHFRHHDVGKHEIDVWILVQN